MHSICIIPARGGSKRIPRKNIKLFLGKPIIAYSIEAALQSELFEEVMVSTDDDEIADVSMKYGAKIPFKRSQKNANDYATTADVIKEVIGKYELSGEVFNTICCLYPTAPFVNPKRLQEGQSLLSKFDSVIPVVEFSYPVYRAFEKENSIIKYKWPTFEKSRSQDLPKLYHDAGQWYWIKKSCFNGESLLSKNTTSIELNPIEVQDIDTENDWRIAELKYGYLQSIK